ncbi:hypothetical protein CQA53_00485 [Helicobacter didelphidarum]|uniref:LPS export ABC transporter periplasmic protein LptC n=1 Tax=Helicobacter didelphidarum TaxID=2040648 RepID=A0A3D8ISG2_9HELI|nr:hypothetical protein [Helicobacter didelphidarum]RDU67531.1 hypothetical protein CQA53_00485 [Helicobacter didelphidarum]
MNKKKAIFRIFLTTKSIMKAFLQKIDFMLLFFLALFMLTLTSFFFFEMPMKNYKKHNELPIMEIHQFILHRFNEQYIDINISGESMQQYQEKEVYKNFLGSKFNDDGSIEHLDGKEVWHIGDEYDFILGINYRKTPYIKFFSEKGVYNIVTEVFMGKGDFFIEDEGMKTMGKNIFYDKKTDVITAHNINSQILKVK